MDVTGNRPGTAQGPGQTGSTFHQVLWVAGGECSTGNTNKGKETQSQGQG